MVGFRVEIKLARLFVLEIRLACLDLHHDELSGWRIPNLQLNLPVDAPVWLWHVAP